MDTKILEILACHVTKGPLIFDKEKSELISLSAKLAYAVKNDIPVMIEEQARELTHAEYEEYQKQR